MKKNVLKQKHGRFKCCLTNYRVFLLPAKTASVDYHATVVIWPPQTQMWHSFWAGLNGLQWGCCCCRWCCCWWCCVLLGCLAVWLFGCLGVWQMCDTPLSSSFVGNFRMITNNFRCFRSECVRLAGKIYGSYLAPFTGGSHDFYYLKWVRIE